MDALSLLVWPALVGLLALLSHAPLGAQVLRRGIVFIDLAIAQVAALGVLVAGLWLPGGDHAHEHGGMAPTLTLLDLAGMLAGVAAAGGAAVGVAWLCRRWPREREALIGLVYIGAAALALLVVSADPRGVQKLAAMLGGDVLWVDAARMLPLLVATTGFLVLQRLRPGWLAREAGFYPAFAVLVSLSVPLLGLYLVFATLIVPALACRGRAAPWPVAVGAAGYGAGLLLSLLADLPSGPCIVLALMLAGVAASQWPGRRPPS